MCISNIKNDNNQNTLSEVVICRYGIWYLREFSKEKNEKSLKKHKGWVNPE